MGHRSTQSPHKGPLENREPNADDVRVLEEIDHDLHRDIIASLRNPMVSDTYRRIHGLLNLILLERSLSGPLMARTLREHLEILAACRARDPDTAEKALEAHFSRALERAMAFVSLTTSCRRQAVAPAAPGGRQMWIGLNQAASAASLTASDSVGWAWQVRARSSAAPANSINTAASAISSPA